MKWKVLTLSSLESDILFIAPGNLLWIELSRMEYWVAHICPNILSHFPVLGILSFFISPWFYVLQPYFFLILSLLAFFPPSWQIGKLNTLGSSVTLTWFSSGNHTTAFYFQTECIFIWKKWEYQTTWPVSWETSMQVRKQQLELDMKQQTGSK